MSRLIHLRGDMWGMLAYFVLLFLGACQLVVAWKRLSGFSLTGYPDRRVLSAALGCTILVGSTAWYFSGRGHFASPDVEGFETLVLLIAGMVLAVLVQGVLASLLFRGAYRPVSFEGGGGECFDLDVGGTRSPALFRSAGGSPVLVLGDYGRPVSDLGALVSRLATAGHPCLAVQLDGGPGGERLLEDPVMKYLVRTALDELAGRTGGIPADVVGIGLGGALAMQAVADGKAGRAVALDPPAREPAGHPATDSARELKPPELLKALLRPAARAPGRRIPLSEVVEGLPVTTGLPAGAVSIVGTGDCWFNSPGATGALARAVGADEPALIPARHSEMAGGEAAAGALVSILGGGS
ncbi:MAG: hypothetical protein KKF41_07160 [Actinobacteria bacterium]|nr:hypothetical protein [Actinomycetota bacterium]MBU1942086.1 hypothetical protein [Actinomycetota bacterium]MBU2687347.1 hypothetical protein [Actinomycetota bacterium]